MAFGRQLFTGCTQENISRIVLLTSMEEIYENAIEKLKDVEEEVRGRGGFQSRTGRYHNIQVTVMKTPIGAPATAIALEELYRLGARVFVKVDTALSLQRRLKPGTLIVPIAAVRAESVSKYFAPPEYPAIPSYRFLEILSKIAIHKKIGRGGKTDIEIVPTVVMSTDMFYLTGKEEYEKWVRLVGALDMDTATLYTIAQVRGLHAGALLIIDSTLWGGPREEVWLESSEEPSIRARREEIEDVIDYAVRLGLEALVAMFEALKAEKTIEKLGRRRENMKTEHAKELLEL